jgi:PAS domain S-box-containing protein/putative nucleotidyltransferase with HDIG domain
MKVAEKEKQVKQGSTALKILILEDLPTDADLCAREIKKVLGSCEFKRVETRHEFLEALQKFKPELIISDFKLPSYDGMSALKLAKEMVPDIPFIIVTGSMNEDTAVECMKAGAWDYIIKEHIKRLGMSVLGVLDQKRIREESKRDRDALIESEKKHRTLFETMAQGVVYQDASGRITAANPAAERILGISKDKITGLTSLDPHWQAIHEDGSDFPGEEHPSTVALRTGRPVYGVIMGVFHRISNAHRWILINAIPQFYPGEDKPYQVYTTFADITEQVKANEAVRKSEKLYRSLFENMLNGYAYCKMIYKNGKPYDFIYLDVNRAFETHTGWKNVIGKKVSEIVPDIRISGKEGLEVFGRVALTGTPERFETYLSAMDMWFSISAYSPEKGYIVQVFDVITERKKNEQLLIEEATRRRILVEQSTDGIVVMDSNGGVYEANKRFAEMLGYSPEEVKKLHVWEWDVRFPREQLDQMIATVDEKGDHFETVHRRKNGTTYDVEISTNGAVVAGQKLIFCVCHDITERKKNEGELRQALEKLGRTVDGTINTISLLAEVRDPYTAGHQKRVAQLAYAIAVEMGLSEEQCESIGVAGILHDIGKVSIPAEILSKPGKLSEVEMSLIKRHPQVSSEILGNIELPWSIKSIIIQHHERLDGSGYPAGLSGDDIVLEARILAVSDVVEAMSSHRPYRPALGTEKALEEITQNSGKLYDPDAVNACVKLFREKGFEFNEGTVLQR